jgi:hypothetical protein
MVQTYNSSYSRGRDRKDCGPEQAGTAWRLYFKITKTKRAGGVLAQMVVCLASMRPCVQLPVSLRKQSDARGKFNSNLTVSHKNKISTNDMCEFWIRHSYFSLRADKLFWTKPFFCGTGI